MTIDVEVLSTDDDIRAAQGVFRTAMVGLPPQGDALAEPAAPWACGWAAASCNEVSDPFRVDFGSG